MIEIIFWAAVSCIVYTFMGYHCLMAVLSKGKHLVTPEPTAPLPEVSIILVMGDEEDNATGRIENLLTSDYERSKVELIIVLDAPSDATEQRARAFRDDRITIHVNESRTGKAASLNHAVAQAKGEILVFCDARQAFHPDAILNLARHFSSPEIGAVSGELIIGDSAGGGTGAYWRMEKVLRRNESLFSSVIGCTGAIYACRKSLYTTIPADTILDDVLVPMQCLIQGHSVKFDPEAIATDPQASTHDVEVRRKIRTLAGNWQLLFRYPGWLLPWKTPLAWQLISHKYLRLLGPYLLGTVFLCNLVLSSGSMIYQGILIGQGFFYFLSALGLLFPATRLKFLSLPATFTFLNWLNAAALCEYLMADHSRGWKKS